MRKIKYLYLIVILLLTGFLTFIACKKSEDNPDIPAPSPLKDCEIISPLDSIVVQTGTIVTIEAGITGFGESVKVAFSVRCIRD